MVKLKLTYIIPLLVASLFIISFAQQKINEKKSELEDLRKQISQLELELRQKNKLEKDNVQYLEKISQQSLLLKKLINRLGQEEYQKETEISEVENDLLLVENEITRLKENYSKYVVWLYKNSRYSKIKYIIDSKSLQQALLRYRYLTFITEKNRQVLARFNEDKQRMLDIKYDLKNQLQEKERLVESKKTEQTSLERKEEDRKKMLTALRKDKRSLVKEIESKRKAEITIKGMIAKLVEADRERKTKSIKSRVDNSKTHVETFKYDSFENFSSLKGKLNWPIAYGKIVRDFGENKNDKLKTVTLNYGVDILAGNNESVFAVAEGIVSAIDWIPGYGSVVIVTHKDEYRTVYGHVTNIGVLEGQKVQAGKLIGKVSDSLEGKILHFEIWNERNYQNPENWLSRK
jgi:septal ring factor EnvC (AmiA/AmiB activator)